MVSSAFGKNNKRVLTLLLHPGFVPAAIVISVLLLTGSITNDFMLDDYIHRGMATEKQFVTWPATAPWDLYVMVPEDDHFRQSSAAMGTAPWWGANEFKISFMRPFGSLSIYLDHLIWKTHASVMMHVVSLCWFVLFLVAAALLFRQFLGNTAFFAVAFLLFAMDDAHLVPATWIANRSALISGVPALLALLFHDRWRREGDRRSAVFAVMLFAVGLLGGEFGIGIFGFIVAHALFLDEDGPRRGVRSLLPYLVVVVIWRILYNLLGYGTFGSDIYIDPVSSPVAFTIAAINRIPVLLYAMLGPGNAEINLLLSDRLKLMHLVVALMFLLFAGYVLMPLVRQNSLARFFLCGMTLSLVPSAATFPHDRLTLLAAIGSMGLLALLLTTYLTKTELNMPKTKRYRLAAGVFAAHTVLIHLIISPLSSPFKISLLDNVFQSPIRAARQFPEIDELAKKTVVLVNGPDMFSSSFLPIWRHAVGLEMPKQVVVLANTLDPIEVRRCGKRSLTVTIEAGHFNVWTHDLTREKSDRMHQGDTVRRADVIYEVLRCNEKGEPVAVRVVFPNDLDDPNLVFMTWEKRDYMPFSVPDVGYTAKPNIDLLELFSAILS
jgi:hypothetical protein